MGPPLRVTSTSRNAIRAILTVTAIALLSACSSAAAPPSRSSAVAVGSAPAETDTPAPSSTATLPPSPTPAPPRPTPIAGAPGSGVVLKLTAAGHLWDVKELNGPADKTFKIAMTNSDDDLHNLVISSGADFDSRLATLAKFKGPATQTLDVPGLPAGVYLFQCTLHDNMKGKLTIK